MDLPSALDFRLVQVTHKTKISKCVSASLLLLDDDDHRPLCLHTLPSLETPLEEIHNIITKSKINPDKNAVGKLISIVEIIKRQFSSQSKFDITKRRKMNENESYQTSSFDVLHQYNQYGSLQNFILNRLTSKAQDQADKQIQIMNHHNQILDEFLDQERKRPRQTHTPYLKVYLSRTRIPSLDNSLNVSYQAPSPDVQIKTTSSQSENVAVTAAELLGELLEDDCMIAPV
ncbi:hypothetical protein O181_032642 [Austropuccinia psidii MF-1]|uniref:Uncharacterized protein n=1 Tax=Austropuccinia psidii MF-1 TaxID=1389203 RepID=A0A9Q3H6F4_9BASI|nr:hypothetical protein [Austropuccinia psidii MF-1]